MDNFILELTKQLAKQERELAELRASVGVVKLYIALQTRPNAPLEALEQLKEIERTFMPFADPHEQKRKEALDLIEAIQQWIRRGTGGLDS